jgi:hypothetical protein
VVKHLIGVQVPLSKRILALSGLKENCQGYVKIR